MCTAFINENNFLNLKNQEISDIMKVDIKLIYMYQKSNICNQRQIALIQPLFEGNLT